ncbi:MAG: acyltransferase [Capsulimonadaceae bacterium]|nr:acyltransferase [Capsulimonadaceae bacterium]
MQLNESITPRPDPQETGGADANVWPVLGALRFLLASVVCCNHYFMVAPFEAQLPWPIYILRLMGGYAAVQGFFLISGYSIASSIKRDASSFGYRRFWRIYPLSLAGLCYALIPFAFYDTGTIHTLAFAFNEPTPSETLAAAAALPCIITNPVSTFGVTWTLTCEILYYMLAPLIAKCRTGIILFTCALSLGAFLVHDNFFLLQYPTDLYLVAPVCMIWWWLSGWLLYQYRTSATAGVLLMGICLTANALSPHTPEHLSELAMFISLLALVFGRQVNMATWIKKLCILLGDISYPLYLTHITTYILIYRFAGPWMMTHSILYLPAAVIVGAAFFVGIDKPVRSFIRGAKSVSGPQNAVAAVK